MLNNSFGLINNLDIDLDVTNLSSMHSLKLTILNIWFFSVRIKKKKMKVAEKYETLFIPCISHTFCEAEVCPMHNFMGESIDHFL